MKSHTQCPLVGTWKLDHTENYDCYLKQLGVNSVKRHLAMVTTNIQEEIRQIDLQTFVCKIWSPVLTKQTTYKLDQELSENTLVGERVKYTSHKYHVTYLVTNFKSLMLSFSIMSWEEEKLFIRCTESRQPQHDVRYLDDGYMIHEYVVNNVPTKHFYLRILHTIRQHYNSIQINQFND
ncbi:uncharacterized protein TRIADDRAFT_59083 [Trichoplax adhaerens]|uniref:Cytosolic fatty-acid binding proteins domain-containing protein n=1 Tax=Trichoplax adhaerens TaxID=10228 RepID=B3S4H1_TRIAD|nr:hypothetical protein TRIADDRAFT_59083 [Trichoplax adhaerens]EDV22464.1 hypothetical protein TRIADDRAFT_59083 [Trichoplax adhaerens]|eukprot:XP_002115008.1 hypothetical protein TRIADDRAFT_59083 [Trichoplax adhaerens]